MTTRRRRKLGVAVLGAITASAVVWQATDAALSNDVVIPGNTWTSGAVTLTDNDAGRALFDSADLAPGAGTPRCIEVTYTGDVAAEVRLSLTGLDEHGQNLGSLLRMRIDLGSGSSCAAPGTWTTVGDATLRTLAGNAGWVNGLGPGRWQPTGRSAATRPYRFTPVLADDDSAQGGRAGFGFVWEARSL
ncbi:hypothetical protein Aab01nite_78180 [Paractinoplanes abujensis]|uniref:Ribosomally synthesized peptide with SipW-like signal peptide n=1 Tax=Paractinoplanes abujensis TaxID=882441 RepID=A0A7W7CPH4_9ACTN|nr:hypothetical protein [Actinoplanes abujensis]MBB4692293.1 hypothetical protein [Actinoplanes abujensis]GID24228.1 hypothetical protein Aab01nite_78180 [Actinoplanes abujensis]